MEFIMSSKGDAAIVLGSRPNNGRVIYKLPSRFQSAFPLSSGRQQKYRLITDTHASWIKLQRQTESPESGPNLPRRSEAQNGHRIATKL